LTAAVVDAGIDVLLTNGTFGEGASVTLDELEAFAEVVVQTVAGRIPVFVGAGRRWATLQERYAVQTA
jgi:4-(2-carboxyphenyl)-2-oxobut-3-enoate aldolase